MSAADPVSGQPALSRVLRARDATAILVGGIIGSGIFVSPSVVARHVTTPGLAVFVWGAAGIIACCGALCYAELGAAMPQTGGTYRFLLRAYRTPLVAFCFGWTFFLVDGPGSIAAVAVTLAAYLGSLLGITMTTQWLLRGVAAGSILALTAINRLGARPGALVQNVATALKIAALVGIVAVALFGHGDAQVSLHPLLPPGGVAAVSWTAFAAALVPALFAYDGWTYTSYVAGEMVDPRRDIPRTIVLALAIVIVVYLAVNVAAVSTLPFTALQQSPHVASDVVARVVGPVGGRLVAAAVAVSCVGSLNAILLVYPRIAFAMAGDGLFFRRAGDSHPRYRSPSTALWIQAAIAATFAVSGTYEQILGYFAFVEFLLYATAIAAVIVLRVREPALPRPYRVWAYPLPPLLFLTVGVWYLSSLAATQWRTSLVGVGILLTGIPFYLYWRRKQRRLALTTTM